MPFGKAPSAVLRAREMIQNRLRKALHIVSNFNEVLSAAYMERQKMAVSSKLTIWGVDLSIDTASSFIVTVKRDWGLLWRACH